MIRIKSSRSPLYEGAVVSFYFNTFLTHTVGPALKSCFVQPKLDQFHPLTTTKPQPTNQQKTPTKQNPYFLVTRSAAQLVYKHASPSFIIQPKSEKSVLQPSSASSGYYPVSIGSKMYTAFTQQFAEQSPLLLCLLQLWPEHRMKITSSHVACPDPHFFQFHQLPTGTLCLLLGLAVTEPLSASKEGKICIAHIISDQVISSLRERV